MKRILSVLIIAAVLLGISSVTASAATNYSWYIEPSIAADDIIVYDDSLDRAPIHSGTLSTVEPAKPSDTYSVLKKNGKYTLINYNAEFFNNVYYSDYGSGNYAATAGSGEIEVFNPNTGGCCYACYDYGNPEEVRVSVIPDNSGIGRKSGSGGFGAFFYDNADKKVYVRGVNYSPLSMYGAVYGPYDNQVLLPFWTKYVDQAIMVADQNLNNNPKNVLLGAYYDGKLTVPIKYKDGVMTMYNNIIAFKSGNKWGYFNAETGKQIIDFICDPIDSNKLLNNYGSEIEARAVPYTFTEGYAAVHTDRGYGYYDTKGNEIIPCGTFEEARPVHNGLAWVKENGKWGIISIGNKTNPTAGKIYGDVDGDGKITSADSLLVLRASVKLENFDNKLNKVADVNRDNKINSSDSLAILRYSVGLKDPGMNTGATVN